MSDYPPYVCYITNTICIERCFGIEDELLKRGYVRQPDDAHIVTRYYTGSVKCYKFELALEEHLIAEINVLRDLGVAFLYNPGVGNDWPPSDQIEELKKQGKLSGSFKKMIMGLNKEFKIVEI